VRAVAHEVRNPLVSIRTFSELLPDHFEDQEFRTHFRELVGQDVQRIEDVVARLQSMIDLGESKPQPVDVADLLETQLDERRSQIQSRRLLVLKELDRGLPYALGDPAQLRDAFAGLLDHVLGQVSDRGDVYLASKHHAARDSGTREPAVGLRGGPTMRVLLRHTSPAAAVPPSMSPDSVSQGISREETALSLLVAETLIRAQGGTLTIDSTDSHESVIVVDLPAPAE
jgi:signal transduction histidine kinase